MTKGVSSEAIQQSSSDRQNSKNRGTSKTTNLQARGRIVDVGKIF